MEKLKQLFYAQNRKTQNNIALYWKMEKLKQLLYTQKENPQNEIALHWKTENPKQSRSTLKKRNPKITSLYTQKVKSST